MGLKDTAGRIALVLVVSVIAGVNTISALRKDHSRVSEWEAVHTAGLSPIILRDNTALDVAAPANSQLQLSSASTVGMAELPLPSRHPPPVSEPTSSPASSIDYPAEQEHSPTAARANNEPLPSPEIVAATDPPRHRTKRKKIVRPEHRRSAPVATIAALPSPWAYNQAVSRRPTPFSYKNQLAPQ